MVTDGGMETDLIFHYEIDLPLLRGLPAGSTRRAGRSVLARYYSGLCRDRPAGRGRGLLLESATWRASPDWGEPPPATRPLTWTGSTSCPSSTAGAGLRQEYGELASMRGERCRSGRAGTAIGPARRSTRTRPPVPPRPRSRRRAAAAPSAATGYTLTGSGEAIGIGGLPATSGARSRSGSRSRPIAAARRPERRVAIGARRRRRAAGVLRHQLRTSDPCRPRRGQRRLA